MPAPLAGRSGSSRWVVAMKSEYVITPPTGKAVHIIARSRAEAIQEYHRMTGTPVEYIKKHCVIKNLGRSA